jgi:hypothetical protein
MKDLNVPTFMNGFSWTFILAAFIGIAWVASGLGMIKPYEWTRKLWLVVILMTLIFGIGWSVLDLRNGNIEWKHLIEPISVLILFAFSWFYLSNRSVKINFKSSKTKPT